MVSSRDYDTGEEPRMTKWGKRAVGEAASVTIFLSILAPPATADEPAPPPTDAVSRSYGIGVAGGYGWAGLDVVGGPTSVSASGTGAVYLQK
jgi:hypothetical protein